MWRTGSWRLESWRLCWRRLRRPSTSCAVTSLPSGCRWTATGSSRSSSWLLLTSRRSSNRRNSRRRSTRPFSSRWYFCQVIADLWFTSRFLFFSVADPWHFGVDSDPDSDPDPDPGSEYCNFRHWPSRCQQKTNFLTQFCLFITFWSYIYIIFQR